MVIVTIVFIVIANVRYAIYPYPSLPSLSISTILIHLYHHGKTPIRQHFLYHPNPSSSCQDPYTTTSSSNPYPSLQDPFQLFQPFSMKNLKETLSTKLKTKFVPLLQTNHLYHPHQNLLYYFFLKAIFISTTIITLLLLISSSSKSPPDP